MYHFFATCPQGLERLLEAELGGLGIAGVRGTRGGVAFSSGALEDAYRVCLHSHLAHRLLLRLARFQAESPDDVYGAVQALDWTEHLAVDGSLLVDAKLRDTQLGNAHFVALKVKDAVVDQLRTPDGVRPSVDLRQPDLRLNLFVHRRQAELSLDLSGGGLRRALAEQQHWRGGLGAAALHWGDIPRRLARAEPVMLLGGGDLDLLISAALMAREQAPGLLLPSFGFERWQAHVPALWRRLCEEARSAQREAPHPLVVWEPQRKILHDAHAACAGLGLDKALIWHEDPRQAPLPGQPAGSVLLPPGDDPRARHGALKAQAQTLRRHCPGWSVVQMSLEDDPGLDDALGTCGARLNVRRGKSAFLLRRYAVPAGHPGHPGQPSREPTAEAQRATAAGSAPQSVNVQPLALSADSPQARMLVNRLRKNHKHLARWARRQQVACYRLYDADLPEYAAAIDIYQTELDWVVVQEYAPPSSIEAETVARRLDEIRAAVAEVLELPLQRIVLKQRRRQKGKAQYEKLARRGQFYPVVEGGLKLLVNFTDYLDTGLFLDHRNTRLELGAKAAGRHVLNLFAYTGVATVHMVAGGARSSTTVDLSKTYLDWAQRNLALNDLQGPAHRYIQADCLEWLDQAAADPGSKRYGLIFMDPPTFSTSKRMEDVLDVQRDHVRLIRAAFALLRPGGELYFSNNFRKFKLDREALQDMNIEDISARSLPEDFKRNPRIHQCFLIRKPGLNG